jgi:hypothetical protein
MNLVWFCENESGITTAPLKSFGLCYGALLVGFLSKDPTSLHRFSRHEATNGNQSHPVW